METESHNEPMSSMVREREKDSWSWLSLGYCDTVKLVRVWVTGTELILQKLSVVDSARPNHT